MIWLLILGAFVSSDSSEVISLDLGMIDGMLGMSNNTIPSRQPLLGDAIVSKGRFTLTLGTQDDLDLGESGVTQEEIDLAVAAASSGNDKRLPSNQRLGLIQDALRDQVEVICEKSQKAPVRTEDLEKLKVKAWGAKQPEEIDRVVTENSLSEQEAADLEEKVKAAYLSVRAELEEAQKEQANLEASCRTTKANLDEMAAAAERMRATRVEPMNLGAAAFNVTKRELAMLPVCKKILGVRTFQKWLSSSHLKDVEMQRKELSCLANRVSEAEYRVKVLKESLEHSKNSGKMLRMGIRCIVHPLVQRLFSSITGIAQDGPQDDIEAFVAAIENQNQTMATSVETDLGEAPDDEKVTLTASHAKKGNEAVPLKEETKKVLPPAIKYECLYDEYQKASGAWATGKAAIEQNAAVELDRVRRMTTDDEPPPVVRLGESLSDDGKCIDFLSNFYNSTDSEGAIEEIKDRLAKTAEPGIPEDADTAAERAETAKYLKGRVTEFVSEMKTVINSGTIKYNNKISSQLRAAELTLGDSKVKIRNAQSELDGILERRGNEEKLMSKGCIDSQCYVGTMIQTKAIPRFASPRADTYQEMTWICRRGSNSEDHTQNSFSCSSEHDNAGSVVCLGKEVRIGSTWIPFLREITCSQDSSCKDTKQCSSNQIRISSTNKEKLLKMTCMTL